MNNIAARVALPSALAHRLRRIHNLVRLAEVVEDVVFFDPLLSCCHAPRRRLRSGSGWLREQIAAIFVRLLPVSALDLDPVAPA